MKYITFPYKPASFLAPVHHGSSKDTGEDVWNQKQFPKKLLPLPVVVAQSQAAVYQRFNPARAAPAIASSRVHTLLPGNIRGSGDIQHFSLIHIQIFRKKGVF